MKMRLIFQLACSLLTITASADVLYWQVKESMVDSFSDYAYATLVAIPTSSGISTSQGVNYLDEYNSQMEFPDSTANGLALDSVGAGWTDIPRENAAVIAVSDLGTLSGESSEYVFFIELINQSAQAVGRSKLISYGDLESGGYVKPGGMPSDFSSITGWDGGYFTAVPEPTSGMLLMMGFGLLGLRRKRRQV